MSDISVLFEQSLRQSGTSLEAFLAEQSDSGIDRNDAEVITQLACVDLTVTWERGRGRYTENSLPSVEDYSQRLPALAPAPIELVEAEYRARLRHGESPDHSEYVERFSHLTEVLPQRLTEIDRSTAGSDHVTENDASAETMIAPAEVEVEATLIADNPATIAQSELPLSHPLDVETILQADGEAPTGSFRAGRGRGRSAASSVLRTFGDYEVLAEIARGGMGVVYRARQTKLNRVVAVKMILQGQLASDDDIQRFYSEAEAAARLEHPGIVPIFEVGEIDDQHYFSMGYVDGESLADRVRRGPLPPREAAELLRQVADAIEYAHRHGVVHRDLKPGNILLTQDGQPRVTDFGLAKTVEGDSGLTASGQILGTPGYMPPEQASGQIRDVGPLSDLYSLGAVLYCLLTGRPPFQSARVIETLQQVVENPPVSPRLLNPAVDLDLETIVLKCLEKQPAHRLSSAAELRDELQRYLNGESIQSRRVGPVTRVWRWCRRKPLAAALVASVIVLGGAVALTVQLAKSAAQTRQLATVVGEFEQTLDQAESTAQWLEHAEQVAGRLEELTALHDGQQSVIDASGEKISGRDARPRVLDAFAALIRRDLRKPKLDTDTAARIQAAIQLLTDRAPQMTDDLQSLLDRRMTDWLLDFELSAPFITDLTPPNQADSGNVPPAAEMVTVSDRSGSELANVFRPLTVEVAGDRLKPVGTVTIVEQAVRSGQQAISEQSQRTYLMAPLLATQVECQADVQIEAVFAKDWQTATEVGVALNADEASGYDFVVKVLAGKSIGGGSATRVELDSVEEVRQRGGSAVAEIRRHGVPLLRQEIDRKVLRGDTLRLRARRVRGDLEFQINDDPPIRYYDPFSIAGHSPGVFALRWPADVSLLSLTAQHRPRAEATTVLEVADALFDEAKFAEAAEQYRQQLAETDDDTIRQEARYKLGASLTALQRYTEAEEVLGPLMAQSNDQWSALAGIQLWVSAVRRHEHENADSLFELLESRFRFEQLATLMPNDVRDEILASYTSAFASVSNVFQFDPNRVRNMERGAAVDRLLSPDGRGRYPNQMELVRAYRFAEDWPKALATIEPLIERSRDTVSMRHYTRILRFLGQPERAVEELDSVISGRVHAFMTDARILVHYLLDRARAHYALGSTAAAEADLRQAVETGQSNWQRSFDPQNHSLATLMLGFLLESRGQREAALDVWRDGYQKSASIYDGLPSAYQTGLVARQALGSLTGELSAEDGDRFLKLLTANDSGNSLVTMGTSLVTPQTITEALQEMWRSKRGRRAAHDLAFETVPLRERLALPMLLMGQAFLRSKALDGVVTDEQDEVLWQAMRRSHRDLLELGKLKMPQLMQLALAWKGTTNFLGWGGVAPTLDADYRATMSWIFGHRFLRLGRRDDALKFFETAIRDAPADSLTADVARRDLELLRQNQGSVSLQTDLRELTVELRRGSEVLATLSGETPQATVPIGDFEAVVRSSNVELLAECDAATGRLTGNNELRLPLRLASGSTATLQVSELWQSRSDASRLPGLVMQPASLPGLGRWQIVRTSLQHNVRAPAWSPDDRFVAVSCDDGLIRVYETATWTLTRIYSGHTNVASHLEWSPDSRYLAAYDFDCQVRIWDDLNGRLHSTPLPTQNSNSSVFWHPDGQSIGLGSYSGVGIQRVALDGTRLEVFGNRLSLHTGAWSPDGEQLAAVDRNRGAFGIWHEPSPHALIPSEIFATGHGFHADQPSSRFESFAGQSLYLDKPTVTVQESGPPLWEAVKWSPDGKLVATGGSGNVSVWEANGWRKRHSWDTQACLWLEWRDGGRELWSSGWNTTVDCHTFADDGSVTVQQIETPGLGGESAIERSGQRLVRTGAARLSVFDRNGSQIHVSYNHRRLVVTSMDWSPGGKRLAVGVEGEVQLFDVARNPATRQCVLRQSAVVRFPRGSAQCVRWSPDATLLACFDTEGDVLLVQPSGEIAAQFSVPAHPHFALDWAADSGRFVMADGNGVLRFVSRTGDIGSAVFDSSGRLHTVRFSPDGQRLAAAGDQAELIVWNVNGDSISEASRVKLDARCLSLSWSPDGNTIAVGGRRVELIQVSDGRIVTGPELPEGIRAVDWLPESANRPAQLIATSGKGDAVVIAADGQQVKALRQPYGRVQCCRASQAGDVIGIGTPFGSVEFFDSNTLQPCGQLLFPAAGRCWSLSSSGQILAETPPAGTDTEKPVQPATGDPGEDSSTDLRWLVESASGEQTLLTRAEFFERLRTLRSRLSAATPPPVIRENVTALEVAGRLSDSSILEASGLVRSRRHAGVFWTISDSGNPARLYAIDATGQLIARYPITGATNHDWETVIADSSGTLWIGDVGNLGHRSVRTLYRVSEPDPHADAAASRDKSGRPESRPQSGSPLIELAIEERIEFGPDSASDDFEAAFEWSGKLYLISKVQTGSATLFRLDPASGVGKSSKVALNRVSELNNLPWITGAAISPDHHRLALTTYAEILLFELQPDGSLPAELKPAARIPFEAPLIESVAFEEDKHLLILSETGDLSRIRLP
ncbi:protein kinase [bacterium]|nr:protein kinase [bacterium]